MSLTTCATNSTFNSDEQSHPTALSPPPTSRGEQTIRGRTNPAFQGQDQSLSLRQTNAGPSAQRDPPSQPSQTLHATSTSGVSHYASNVSQSTTQGTGHNAVSSHNAVLFIESNANYVDPHPGMPVLIDNKAKQLWKKTSKFFRKTGKPGAGAN
jgi:hypothetical protein